MDFLMKDHKQNRTLQTHFTYITLILKSSSIYFTVLQNNIYIFSQCSYSSYHTILTFFDFEIKSTSNHCVHVEGTHSNQNFKTNQPNRRKTSKRSSSSFKSQLQYSDGVDRRTSGSDYDDGLFQVEIDYHTNPKIPPRIPSIRFVTKIYHPNISQHGNIAHYKIEGLDWAV